MKSSDSRIRRGIKYSLTGLLVLLFLTMYLDDGKAANSAGGKRNQQTSASSTIGTAQANPGFTQKIVQGVFVVKFRENTALPDGATKTGYSSLDRKIAEYRVNEIDRAFPYLQNSNAVKKSALERVYYFRYSNGDSPIHVAGEFAKDLNVEYAEPQYAYPLEATPNDQYYSQMTQFPHIQAPAAWDVVKGEQGSVIIADVDGGTEWQHPDLVGNVWTNPGEIPNNGIDDDGNGFVDDVHGWNFSNNSNDPTGNPSTPQSASHGTHTAGTAAGVTNNTIGVSSISWNVTLMPINAAHPTSDNLILYGYQGITYAAANGADIINCSWGGLGNPSSLEQDVIDFAYNNGALVVAAAGNNGVNNDLTSHYPSTYNHVLSVGATNKTNDSKASFSNYGVTVDVYAPGVSILSTVPGSSYSSTFWSGTSMASPLAAGLAALVKTQHPTWTVDQVREQVRTTSDDMESANPSYTGLLGKGRINALRAVTEYTSPAIRISNVSFLDSGGDGIINAGETVDVTITFINYLSDASSVNVTLYDNDNNITITNASGTIPTLNTNQTGSVTLQFTVANGVTDGYVLRLFTNITATGYSDRDFFRLVVNPPQFAELNTGPVQTAITTEGNIGWIGFQGQGGGVGFVYNGTDNLFEGGLLIGTSSSQVSDCIRGADQSVEDNDFKPAAGEVISITSPGQRANQEGSILLVDSLAPSPIGISVLQETLADTSADYNKFVIFKYTIANNNSTAISNLYAGLFFDWDINSTASDWTGFDQARRMGFAENAGSSPTRLLATKLLTTGAATGFRAIDNSAEIYDGFSNTEKWNYLSGGIQTQTLTNRDISTMLSQGPFNIAPNSSVIVAFAVIGGASTSDLETNADNAQSFWDNPPTAVQTSTAAIPGRFSLEQNFPNPFNPSTTFKYELPQAGNVTLTIFNTLGQKVRTLVDGSRNAGLYSVMWNGKNENGEFVPSGIYFYRLAVSGKSNFTQTRKMMLLK